MAVLYKNLTLNRGRSTHDAIHQHIHTYIHLNIYKALENGGTVYKNLTINRGRSTHDAYTALRSDLEAEAVKIEKIAVNGVYMYVCVYVCMFSCMCTLRFVQSLTLKRSK